MKNLIKRVATWICIIVLAWILGVALSAPANAIFAGIKWLFTLF